jgi:hypothetical protein
MQASLLVDTDQYGCKLATGRWCKTHSYGFLLFIWQLLSPPGSCPTPGGASAPVLGGAAAGEGGAAGTGAGAGAAPPLLPPLLLVSEKSVLLPDVPQLTSVMGTAAITFCVAALLLAAWLRPSREGVTEAELSACSHSMQQRMQHVTCQPHSMLRVLDGWHTQLANCVTP